MAEENLIKSMIQAGCIKLGEFKLKSGATSNIYINLRNFDIDLQLRKCLVEAVCTKVPVTPKTCLIGVPTGAVALASLVADKCNIVRRDIRKEVKQHGDPEETPDGDYQYVIIEDVVTSGGSIIEMLKRIGTTKVRKIIAVVDREAGGKDNLRNEFPNIEYEPILKLSDIEKYRLNNKV